jgi:hypothetical protein
VEVSEAAAHTYRWLQALDPHHRERQELLAGNVPSHTARNLYPLNFDALVPAILEQLRQVHPQLPENTSRVAVAQAFSALSALEPSASWPSW